MSRKIYWKIRNVLLSILFKAKSFEYIQISKIKAAKGYSSLWSTVRKKAFWGLLKGFVLVVCLNFIDKKIASAGLDIKICNSIFTAVLIGGIGVAGVILGLYYSTISSIYSLKYASAPEIISNAFRYDKLTNKCTEAITDYIIFLFIVVFEMLLDWSVGLMSVAIMILWSIIVIISYSIVGNRAYQLSNVYRVADDSYTFLRRVISCDLGNSLFVEERISQYRFMEVCEKHLKFLSAVQKYGETLGNMNSAMEEFMCKNLKIVRNYWKKKQCIVRSSCWYRNEKKYQKWHFAGAVPASLALETGTSLPAIEEHNYWWFEDEVFSINRRCVGNLVNCKDYSNLLSYLQYFETLCDIAISNKEIKYFVGQIDYLQKQVCKLSEAERINPEESRIFAAIVEQTSLLYLELILKSSKYYESYDVKKKISLIINNIDSGKKYEKCKELRGNEQIDFYEKIITEIKVEGKRLTPDWVIAQNVASQEYTYIIDLEDAITEGIDKIFGLGQKFQNGNNKSLTLEACIILMKFYEYKSKLTRFIDVIELREKEFGSYHVEQSLKWEQSHIKELKQTIDKWNGIIPELLMKCSSEFAIKNWEKRDLYPDFLGECYNHVCKDAVESIVCNNIKQFKINFDNLSKMMLLYQEYVRSDLTKTEDMFRIEYTYYAFVTPIVEWAQIGGLAILWGEFMENKAWFDSVKSGISVIIKCDEEGRKLSEKLIEFAQDRDKIWRYFGYRGMLEASWKQSVACAIKKSDKYEKKYERYKVNIKTESKLIKAFCRNFDSLGFTIEPSEIFWVLCINPMLSKEKQFHSKTSWEEYLNV